MSFDDRERRECQRHGQLEGYSPALCRTEWTSTTCRLLLEKGADINTRGNGNRTALHCAAWGSLARVCQSLVERGMVDINARDARNKTPLHYAAEGGHRMPVAFLSTKMPM